MFHDGMATARDATAERDGAAPRWPRGDGEMAERIRAHDWAATPLGPVEGWPQSLRIAVGIMLASGHAMQLAWGPERIVLYNDAYAPMLGNRHPGALGIPFQEAWPDVWKEIEPLVERVFAGETVRFENLPLVMTRSGYPEETWWAFSYSPVRDEAGAVAGLLNVTVDATARIRAARAEVALRESEERFRALVTASSYAVYRMAPDWSELRQLDGRGFIADTPDPSRAWLDAYIHPDDRPGVLAAIQEAIRTKGMFELEHRVRRADGSLGWTHSRAVPLFDAAGDIREWFGAASDVTGRKRSEDALRGSEARLRALVEGVPQPVWRAVGEGERTWASPQWAAYTGQAEEASLGHGWLEAVHPDDRGACLAAWRATGAHGVLRWEHRLRHAGEDRWRWVQAQAMPVRDGADAEHPDGRATEWFGTTTDVDDLRRRRHEEAILVAELQHRSRNLLTVVGGVADQTLAASRTLDEFGARFEQRLAALGRVQGLLSRGIEPNVTADELVRLELAAHGVDADDARRVRLSGAPVVLPARTVQLLALALHELLTNAVKHGALGRGGLLTIAWREERGGSGGAAEGTRLRLDWVEEGAAAPVAGEPTAAPPQRGFGRDLIEHTLPYELDAETRLRFTGDGVRCSIELPLESGGPADPGVAVP